MIRTTIRIWNDLSHDELVILIQLFGVAAIPHGLWHRTVRVAEALAVIDKTAKRKKKSA
jgi:hypothetical protein